jgi:hypothetical protein
VKIKALHDGGIDLTEPTGYTEQIGQSLLANDPYWYETTDTGKALAGQTSVAVKYICRRTAAGVWQKMGDLNGQVNAIAISPLDGNIYITGAFTSDTVTAVTLNRTAVWNENTSAWEALGTGVSSTGNCLTVDVDGTVYVGTQSNGARSWTPGAAAFSAVVGPVSPVLSVARDSRQGIVVWGDTTVRALAYDKTAHNTKPTPVHSRSLRTAVGRPPTHLAAPSVRFTLRRMGMCFWVVTSRRMGRSPSTVSHSLTAHPLPRSEVAFLIARLARPRCAPSPVTSTATSFSAASLTPQAAGAAERYHQRL